MDELPGVLGMAPMEVILKEGHWACGVKKLAAEKAPPDCIRKMDFGVTWKKDEPQAASEYRGSCYDTKQRKLVGFFAERMIWQASHWLCKASLTA